MKTTASVVASTATTPVATPVEPGTRLERSDAFGADRFDLYAQMHKGLRAFMAATLVDWGRLDCHDDPALKAGLDQLEQLLDACATHLDKENHYVHPAIEARRTGHSLRIASEHVEHLVAIEHLRTLAEALADAPSGARDRLSNRLYREIAIFVAENLEHMEVEETRHNAALWATHSDAELMDIHAAIVAVTSPVDMAVATRWLAPNIRPAELAALLQGVQAGMPAEMFQGVVDLVRPHLAAPVWARMAQALGLPEPVDTVEQFLDAAFVRFDTEAVARLVTPGVLAHPCIAVGLPAGVAGLQALVQALGTAFDQTSVTVLDRMVCGDRQSLRYRYTGRHVGSLFGMAPTGRSFSMEGIAILRLEGERVAEYWREEDMLGLQRQLGLASLVPEESAQ
ncbi:ester cyclase [Hydrogenophaga sp.]|uniref:ester cyclase n=1 Tax=Hydrogenophaga sp. TaxID=1904254 RepID=UPI003561E531